MTKRDRPKLPRGPGAALRPFEVLYLAAFLLYLFVPVRNGDDVWFISTFLTGFQGDLGEFLSFRYQTWSTRLLLEAFTLLLLRFPVLFRLSIPLWLTAIAVGTERLAGGLDRRGQWALCLGTLLLPLGFLGRAGFVCSSVNYVFALACILWAVLPIVEALRGQRPPLWRQALSVPLLVMGCSMEYYCPPVLLLLLFLLGLCVKGRKNPALTLILLAVAAASTVFAFNAPANTLDGYAEADFLFPGYKSLSALDKLRVGFVSTAGGLLSTYTNGDHFLIGSLTLGGLLALRGWERERGALRAVHAVPLLTVLATGCAARLCPEGSLWRRLFLDGDGGWLWDHPVPLALSFLYFSALLVCLWREGRGLCLWTALALICRVSMGASRSVFGSGLRTFFPMLAALAMACALVCRGLEKRRRAGTAVLSLGAGASVLMNAAALLMM